MSNYYDYRGKQFGVGNIVRMNKRGGHRYQGCQGQVLEVGYTDGVPILVWFGWEAGMYTSHELEMHIKQRYEGLVIPPSKNARHGHPQIIGCMPLELEIEAGWSKTTLSERYFPEWQVHPESKAPVLDGASCMAMGCGYKAVAQITFVETMPNKPQLSFALVCSGHECFQGRIGRFPWKEPLEKRSERISFFQLQSATA